MEKIRYKLKSAKGSIQFLHKFLLMVQEVYNELLKPTRIFTPRQHEGHLNRFEIHGAQQNSRDYLLLIWDQKFESQPYLLTRPVRKTINS